jgi:hypothetical protein
MARPLGDKAAVSKAGNFPNTSIGIVGAAIEALEKDEIVRKAEKNTDRIKIPRNIELLNCGLDVCIKLVSWARILCFQKKKLLLIR